MENGPRSAHDVEVSATHIPSPPAAGLAKVLVVDDEYACRDSLALLLSLEKFDVQTAANAKEALEIGARFAPNLLIADWMLGDAADGLQVAEALLMLHPSMRVIVVTGYPSCDLEDRVRALPYAQYFTKPYRPGELIAAARLAAGLPV